MRFFSTTGYEFDSEGGFAKSGTQYAQLKGLSDTKVFLAKKGDDSEYVIIHKGEPFYNSKSFDAIGCFIDVLDMLTKSPGSFMTNEDIIKAVNKWQNFDMFHPLTCGKDSRHRNLVPEEVNGKVILRCLDCDYLQDHVPDVVLSINWSKLEDKTPTELIFGKQI